MVDHGSTRTTKQELNNIGLSELSALTATSAVLSVAIDIIQHRELRQTRVHLAQKSRFSVPKIVES